MKSRLKPLLYSSLIAAVGGAVMTAAVAGMTTPAFRTYDGNADGSISLEEFQAQGGLVKAFHDGDANHDQRLSKDELVQASASTERLMSGNFVDDAWITAKVKTMLLKDDVIRGLSVNVETQKGTVQLSGWVNDETQIAHAEQVARRIDGVKSVRNDLQVNKR
ncbi:MAG: BON domain-containing protein [Thiobacillus sp.]|nr:BON domain-containing protein [Thiobacillus sp.]